MSRWCTQTYLCDENAEYRRSVRNDIKGRKMIQSQEGEEDMETWTYHCQDD